MGNPILEQAVEYVREETALDVVLREEGGMYFLTLAGHVLGPMNHGQTWYALIAMSLSRAVHPTLETRKVQRAKEFDEILHGKRQEKADG